MQMKVLVGAKVLYKEGGESFIGCVVGLPQPQGNTALVKFYPEYVKGWMHDGGDDPLYNELGELVHKDEVGDCFWFIPFGELKVLGYE